MHISTKMYEESGYDLRFGIAILLTISYLISMLRILRGVGQKGSHLRPPLAYVPQLHQIPCADNLLIRRHRETR
jgi:hypothetical protein